MADYCQPLCRYLSAKRLTIVGHTVYNYQTKISTAGNSDFTGCFLARHSYLCVFPRQEFGHIGQPAIDFNYACHPVPIDFEIPETGFLQQKSKRVLFNYNIQVRAALFNIFTFPRETWIKPSSTSLFISLESAGRVTPKYSANWVWVCSISTVSESPFSRSNK